MIRRVKAGVAELGMGLQEVDLHGLGRVVVLAGPNGGGKTRLLKEVERLYKHGPRQHEAKKAAGRRGPTDDERALAERWSGTLDVTEEPTRIPWVDLQATSLSQTSLDNAMDIRPHQISGLENELRSHPSLRTSLSRAHVALLRWATLRYHARHPDHRGDPTLDDRLTKAQELESLLFELLGVRPTYTIEHDRPWPQLFGRHLNNAQLSPGQEALLAWAVSLHYHQTGSKLTDAIVAIDEPENHLHPSAAVDALRRLTAALERGGHGQLWIATHSPAIVAAFGAESVFLVEDGKASFAGNRLDALMDRLLGGPEARVSFGRFFTTAHEASFLRFSAQALAAPTVSDAAGDPQSNQVESLLREVPEGQRLRVLDYAPGRGRFARALREAFEDPSARRFEYYAYVDPAHDKDLAEDLAECRARVTELKQGLDGKDVSQEISDFHSSNQVDLVVLCNVLHEIPPNEWSALFRRCQDVLKDTGRLVIFEDQELSVGELPHTSGFLPLCLGEVRRLFGASGEIRGLSSDPRLSVIEVPKNLLGRELQLWAAIADVRDRATRELKELRQSPRVAPGRSGRLHAFYALLLANAHLALDALGVSSRVRE